MPPQDKSKQVQRDLLWAVITLAVSSLIQVVVILRAWAKTGWDPDAPVPMRLFLLVAGIQLAALLVLLVKLLWFNYAVAVFG